MMATEAERRFHADMVAGTERLQREIGYSPTRFRQMGGELGGVRVARHLLRGGMPPMASLPSGNMAVWT